MFQFYPENDAQVELVVSQAMRAGFTGGLVVDFPNSTKVSLGCPASPGVSLSGVARKWYGRMNTSVLCSVQMNIDRLWVGRQSYSGCTGQWVLGNECRGLCLSFDEY